MLLPWRTTGDAADPCACCCRTKTIEAYKEKCGYNTYVTTTPPQMYLTETLYDDATVCGSACDAPTQATTYDRITCQTTVAQSVAGCIPDMITGGPGGTTCTETLTATYSDRSCTTPNALYRCSMTSGGLTSTNFASRTLTTEYTTAQLLADIDALQASCSFDDLDWGQEARPVYDSDGTPDCSNVVADPCDLAAIYYQDGTELWAQKQWLQFLSPGESYCATFTPADGSAPTTTTVACTPGVAVTIDPPATPGIIVISFGDCAS